MARNFRNLLLLFFLFVSLHTYGTQNKVDFVFAYDVQQGFPSFMGNGVEIPEENPGTYIEILQRVAQRLPINLILERYPWERCKSYLAQDKVDSINSSYKASREKIGMFPKRPDGSIDDSRRITSDTYRLYALRGSDIVFDSDKRQIRNIGTGLLAPKGYSIISDFKKWGIPVQEHPIGMSEMFKMLVYGRTTGVIAHENQASYLLTHEKYLSDIVPIEPAISEKPYYILISKGFYKKHPQLAEQIWNEIGRLRKTELPEMLKRYSNLLISE